MKKNNNKGFTLAELLIVVAIIAVLTAIAIPVFTTQLEKSREATDLANMRSAYALVQAAALTQDSAADFAAHSDSTTTFSSTGTVAGGDLTYKAVVTLRQTQTGWQTDNNNDNTTIGTDITVTSSGTSAKTGAITISAQSSGYYVLAIGTDGSVSQQSFTTTTPTSSDG